MENKLGLPYAHADKQGLVICHYCGKYHRHGGKGNGVASGQRMADCGLGEYIVVPFKEQQTFSREDMKNFAEWVRNGLLNTEYSFNGREELLDKWIKGNRL